MCVRVYPLPLSAFSSASIDGKSSSIALPMSVSGNTDPTNVLNALFSGGDSESEKIVDSHRFQIIFNLTDTDDLAEFTDGLNGSQKIN